MPQPDVTTPLTRDLIAQVLQRVNQAACGYAAGRLHAASTGINSSLT